MASNQKIIMDLSIASRIKKMINEFPESKVCNKTLIANIWLDDLRAVGLEAKKINAHQLLSFYINDKLTNPETIRRTRAKILKKERDLQSDEVKAE